MGAGDEVECLCLSRGRGACWGHAESGPGLVFGWWGGGFGRIGLVMGELGRVSDGQV